MLHRLLSSPELKADQSPTTFVKRNFTESHPPHKLRTTANTVGTHELAAEYTLPFRVKRVARRDYMKRRFWFVIIATLFSVTMLSLAQDRGQLSPKSQERITREVRHELLMLPWFGVFDNIAFKVDGSTVTLLGQVVRPSLKSDAENSIKHIEGVEKVDNQIEVLPPSPDDDRFRLRLYREIYGFPALEKYALGVQKPIRIIVKMGRVTLEGVVDNDADKNL